MNERVKSWPCSTSSSFLRRSIKSLTFQLTHRIATSFSLKILGRKRLAWAVRTGLPVLRGSGWAQCNATRGGCIPGSSLRR